MTNAMIVSSLVCHSHVRMAIDCLGSLQRLCISPLQFQIHDDGTLTDDDCAREINSRFRHVDLHGDFAQEVFGECVNQPRKHNALVSEAKE